MATLNDLVDNFDDNSKDGAKWVSPTTLIGPLNSASLAGSVAETNGRVEVTTPASADGANGYRSLATDLVATDSAAYVKVTPPSANPVATPGLGHLIVINDISDSGGGAHYAKWQIHLSRFGDPITISAQYFSSGNAGTTWSADYDAVAHQWLRIRFTASNLFWETSPDGVTWTVRRQISDDPGIYTTFDIAAVGFYAEADDNTQAAHTWVFDSFNTLGQVQPPTYGRRQEPLLLADGAGLGTRELLDVRAWA